MKLILLALCLVGTAAHSQTQFKIGVNKDNNIKLSGTSSLHDWEMNSKTFSGNAQFLLKAGNNSITLKNLEFVLPVKQLKSEKKALTKNALKALKSEKYKNISYKLKSAKSLEDKGSKYRISTVGNLTISGETREVVIQMDCIINNQGRITCSGQYNIKMSDFKVDPPKFMGGMMTTGDDIVLDFTMVFER